MAEASMSTLLGRVVVVAGSHAAFPELVAAFVDAGAFVAFVSIDSAAPTAHADFRANPNDATVWERVAPHVEQRLGPVDLVLGTPDNTDLLETVFRTDLIRRGHGDILTAAETATTAELFSQAVGTH